MLWIVKLTGSVVIKNVTENVWITVEKVLFALLVVKELALVRTKKSVRILLEGVPPSLEATAAHVYQQLLVVGFATILWNRRRWQWMCRDRHPTNRRCTGEWQPCCHRGHARWWNSFPLSLNCSTFLSLFYLVLFLFFLLFFLFSAITILNTGIIIIILFFSFIQFIIPISGIIIIISSAYSIITISMQGLLLSFFIQCYYYPPQKRDYYFHLML